MFMEHEELIKQSEQNIIEKQNQAEQKSSSINAQTVLEFHPICMLAIGHTMSFFFFFHCV
jgi:hypothetical protein